MEVCLADKDSSAIYASTAKTVLIAMSFIVVGFDVVASSLIAVEVEHMIGDVELEETVLSLLISGTGSIKAGFYALDIEWYQREEYSPESNNNGHQQAQEWVHIFRL